MSPNDLDSDVVASPLHTDLPVELWDNVLLYLELSNVTTLRATCKLNKSRCYDNFEKNLVVNYRLRITKRSISKLQTMPPSLQGHMQAITLESHNLPSQLGGINIFADGVLNEEEQKQNEEYIDHSDGSQDCSTGLYLAQDLSSVLLQIGHVDHLVLGGSLDIPRAQQIIYEETKCSSCAEVAAPFSVALNKAIWLGIDCIDQLFAAMYLFTVDTVELHNVSPCAIAWTSDRNLRLPDFNGSPNSRTTRLINLSLLWNVVLTGEVSPLWRNPLRPDAVASFFRYAHNLTELKLSFALAMPISRHCHVKGCRICSLSETAAEVDRRYGIVIEQDQEKTWTKELGELLVKLARFGELSKLTLKVDGFPVPAAQLAQFIAKRTKLTSITLQNVTLEGGGWTDVFGAITKLTHLEELNIIEPKVRDEDGGVVELKMRREILGQRGMFSMMPILKLELKGKEMIMEALRGDSLSKS